MKGAAGIATALQKMNGASALFLKYAFLIQKKDAGLDAQKDIIYAMNAEQDIPNAFLNSHISF